MDDTEIRRRMMILFHRMGKLAAMMDASAMSRGDFVVLDMTAKYQKRHPEQQGIPVSVLINELKNAPSSVSRTLRRLEEKEYVERIVDREDRRNVYVRITDCGERLRGETQREMDSFMERVVTRMGTGDMESLLNLLEKFTVIAREESNIVCERRTPGDDENHEISEGE